jgi:hypothetical protein
MPADHLHLTYSGPSRFGTDGGAAVAAKGRGNCVGRPFSALLLRQPRHIEAIDDSRKFGVQRAQAALRHMHAHVLGRHRGVR